MPIHLSDVQGTQTLAELRDLLANDRNLYTGRATLPGGTAETDQITGAQFPMFVTLALDPVMNDRGDTVLSPALPENTTLEQAVPKVRQAYRLSQAQQLYGVIDEWRQRRARGAVQADAVPSPATQRTMQTWLGLLTRGETLGGDNTHIDAAIAKTSPEVKAKIAERIWGVETQGQWQLMRTKLIGQFGDWKYSRRVNDDGTPMSAEERQAWRNRTRSTPMAGAPDEGMPGDGEPDEGDEPF